MTIGSVKVASLFFNLPDTIECNVSKVKGESHKGQNCVLKKHWLAW